MDLAGFLSAYLGVANTGDNPVNRGQCVGLVEQWLDAQHKPHIAGNAKDLLANADLHSYKVTGNLPANYPPAGAIIVWGASWGAGYGHCAVVIGANRHYLAVFEQNNPTGHPPVVATHGYTGVVGWISW